MKRLFLLALLTFSVALVAVFPGSTAQAAASGSISGVCYTGSNITVTVTVTGNSGDQVAVIVGNNPLAVVGTIGSAGTTYVFRYTTSVGAQAGQNVVVLAGTYTGGGALGAGLSGSGNTFAPGTCVASVGYGNGGTTGIPYGFIQRGIGCTVPVYSQPDGTIVGSNVLLKGQNWYVNPKPVRGKNRRLWTEVYVSGPVDGYVLTKCVLPYAFP